MLLSVLLLVFSVFIPPPPMMPHPIVIRTIGDGAAVTPESGTTAKAYMDTVFQKPSTKLNVQVSKKPVDVYKMLVTGYLVVTLLCFLVLGLAVFGGYFYIYMWLVDDLRKTPDP
jgi:hypothetical protein